MTSEIVANYLDLRSGDFALPDLSQDNWMLTCNLEFLTEKWPAVRLQCDGFRDSFDLIEHYEASRAYENPEKLIRAIFLNGLEELRQVPSCSNLSCRELAVPVRLHEVLQTAELSAYITRAPELYVALIVTRYLVMFRSGVSWPELQLRGNVERLLEVLKDRPPVVSALLKAGAPLRVWGSWAAQDVDFTEMVARGRRRTAAAIMRAKDSGALEKYTETLVDKVSAELPDVADPIFAAIGGEHL